jgi:endoglycosylceramidase
MVKFVNKLGENGIYTMLDFHQDLISEKFCGDGVPVWLID